jgi:hypothetical protein
MTLAMRILRLQNPSMRRTKPVAIIHSGGKQTIFGCVCGAQHTTATRYRGKTRHEADFRLAHKYCAERIVAEQPIVVHAEDAL